MNQKNFNIDEMSIKKFEKRLEDFENETRNGLYEIIDKMHKHSIGDYRLTIEADLEDKTITTEYEFEKSLRKQFDSMFEHINEEIPKIISRLKKELEIKLCEEVKEKYVFTESNNSDDTTYDSEESDMEH